MLRKLTPFFILAFSIFMFVSLATYNALDISVCFDSNLRAPITNWGGVLGANLAAVFLFIWGCAAFLFVPILFRISLITANYYTVAESFGMLLVLLFCVPLISTICYVYSFDIFAQVYPGGILGAHIENYISRWLEPTQIKQFLGLLLWACGIMLFRLRVMRTVAPVYQLLSQLLSYIPMRQWANSIRERIAYACAPVTEKLSGLYLVNRNNRFDDTAVQVDAGELMSTKGEQVDKSVEPIWKDPFWHEYLHPGTTGNQQEQAIAHKDENIYDSLASSVELNCEKTEAELAQLGARRNNKKHTVNSDMGDGQNADVAHKPYKLPSVAQLSVTKESAVSEAQLRADNENQARVLEQKLEQFGIHGKVVAIHQGPSITLFEYQPTIDTKISNILARENDLALALQAISLRIIAPIAGKSVVGFEVARAVRKTIYFSEIFSSSQFTQFSGLLPLVIGKDTLGKAIVVDLARMPHVLIAGSTGSGKSIGLHALIMSLLCSKTPEQVKFILIDPKRLEFSPYADIPHLLFPIVTDPKKAVSVLAWAAQTMDERYELMAREGVRNIEEYQKKYPGTMSFIVIVIDELADLMMTAGKDVEFVIGRLAQMARAAGIHIIIATQRPSVDVITGVIKVNFPSRIAFKVTSKVDSRTIIDGMGAEKLLGKGDMLFLDSAGSIQRIQGVYVPEVDINTVAAFIKAQQHVVYEELHVPEQAQISDEESDALFDQVINYVQTKDEISISLLQRVFKIGYNRSARIIDQLEAQGVIQQATGSKMRKVVKEQ